MLPAAPVERPAPQRPHAAEHAAPRHGPHRPRPQAAPDLTTMWAVHPCPIHDPRNKPGPWFQFRIQWGFEWNRVQLPVPNLPRALEGLRILHVTDFHLHRYWDPPYDALLRRIKADPPDLLLSGGDYVEDKRDHRPALPFALRLVDGFRARLGVFGILGNHDKRRMMPHLKRTRMRMIDGDRVEIPIGNGGTTIDLIGLPGVHRSELTNDFLASIPRRREDSLRIVLSHFPDHLRRTQFPLQPDLFLTGHTHGGQCCLPGGFPIVRHDTLPRRLCSGIHWVERTWLVSNRGFGFSGMQLRLFCPAEVLDLRLTRMT